MAGGRVYGRGVFLWCAVGTVAGLLVGCSSGDEVKETFTPTATGRPAPVKEPGGASSTAGASPSAVYEPATATSPAKNVPVPKYPDAAKAETEEGQKAFIEYWFKTYNYAFDTGDAKPLQAISGPDCEFCSDAVRTANEIFVRDKTWRVSKGAVPDIKSANFRGKVEAESVWDAPIQDHVINFWDVQGASQKYQQQGGSTPMGRFWLARVSNQWTMSAAAVVEED